LDIFFMIIGRVGMENNPCEMLVKHVFEYLNFPGKGCTIVVPRAPKDYPRLRVPRTSSCVLEAPRIDHRRRAVRHICIKIHSTTEFDGIFADEPAYAGIIVAGTIIVQ